MKVLVTGAKGFLGRYVVEELIARGFDVRALVRSKQNCPWTEQVEIFEGDLRYCKDLVSAFYGIDALIHLAACKRGNENAQFDSTVVGTERLLEAMSQSQTKRILFASSLSVYDFHNLKKELTVESPLESDLYRRDGYAITKAWQERVVRKKSNQFDWDLTVFRPGMIWGETQEYPLVLSIPIGRLHFVIGPLKPPNMVHVKRCAATLVDALKSDRNTIHIIDKEDISAWSFMGRYLKSTNTKGIRIPIPYRIAYGIVRGVYAISRWILKENLKIPSIFIPCRFEARFKPFTWVQLKVIAYFTSCYPRASDTFIRNEVKQLRQMGFNVFTFSVRKPDQEHFVSEEIKQEFENTHYLLGNYTSLFASILFCHPLKLLKALSLAYKTCSPGFKAHVWQLAYLLEACYLARLLRKNNVYHLHNHIGEASATVALLASTLSDIPFSQTIHGPGIFYHPVRWALGEKISHSTFTRCISHYCKSQCMAFSKQPDWNKLHVVHCSIDHAFLSTSLSPITKLPRLLAIGRLEAIKGYHLLLRAAEQLRKENIPFKLVFIGDGPLKAEIQQTIKEKNLEGCVTLLGWVGTTEVKKEIENARAIVSASLNEGLPIVLMEALALGRPVISPCISGIPELVVNGTHGYLYPAGSLEDLVETMKKVLVTDEKVLEEMGKRGAHKVNTEYNIVLETKKLAALIVAGQSKRTNMKKKNSDRDKKILLT